MGHTFKENCPMLETQSFDVISELKSYNINHRCTLIQR